LCFVPIRTAPADPDLGVDAGVAAAYPGLVCAALPAAYPGLVCAALPAAAVDVALVVLEPLLPQPATITASADAAAPRANACLT
jgi:hypothetical protein